MVIFHLILFYLCTNFSNAAEAPKAAAPKSFGVRYGSAPWNKNSKTIDSAFIFLRDQNSGKVAKIILEETEPDSSLFSGHFSINWQQTTPIAPEIYIPPQNLRDNSKAVENFNALLQNSKIKSQPLLIRKDKTQQILEVYDTPEQAARARDVYQQEIEANKKMAQAQLIKPKVSESSLQVAQAAAQASAIAKFAQEAAARESERLRLEQLELQKIAEKKKQQAQLAQAEQLRRQQQARELSLRAKEHYMKGEFVQAEKVFRQAVELDPNNKENYFMFGVSLYRTEKFDEALVTLKIAESTPQTNLEKTYYMGLIHFRLKELAQARQDFATVKNANDPVLSPSAAFYEGMVFLAEENLTQAQASFEYVLDNSQDPALDKKAEEYLEKITRLNEFKKMAATKIFINARAGLSYDSNILLTPDNDSSTASATNKAGARWNLGGDAEYRFIYRESSDLSVKIAASNMQSFSTDFVQADPFTYSATIPYNLKGLWKGKGYKLGLTPGYEALHLDYDASGTPTHILNTIVLNTDFMLVMNDGWFSSYTLDVRNDDSLIPDVTDDNNADAIKISLKKSEILFLDATKKRALIGALGYVMNNAQGDEKKYSRIELNAIYTAPLLKYKNMTWNTGLSFYSQNFSENTAERKDTNTTFLLGLNKMINERWSWGTNATYTSNVSNVTASDYSQYILLGTLNYCWSR